MLKFFRVKDTIGISCKAILLTAAILVGISGPVAAMVDPTLMLMHFYGNRLKYTGINMLGATQSWSVPECDICVDAVAGDDSNPGTLEEPLQTIAALESAGITEGMKIGLKAGSYWREQLDITEDNVEVYGYGTGGRPTLDASDVAANEDFSLIDGLTNAYQITWIHGLASGEYLSVWEDGERLTFVADEATVESTPGSFTVPTVTTSPSTIKIHPTESTNPTSDGKTYEISRREAGLISRQSGTVVKNIHTRRNGANDGSLIVDDLSFVHNCIAEDGTKHNLYVGGGTVAETVAWEFDPSVRGGATMFVAYQTGTTGREVVFDKCIASSDVPAKASAFYSHAGTGTFGKITLKNSSSNCGLVGLNSAESVVIDTVNLTYDAKGMLQFLGSASATDTLDISNVYLDGRGTNTSFRPIVIEGTSESNISNLSIIYNKSVDGGVVYTLGNVNISNSVFYQQGTTSWPYVINPRNVSAMSFNKSIIYGGSNNVYGIYDVTTSGDMYSGNENVFYPDAMDFRIRSTTYTSFTAYKAAGVQDLNSISNDPLFTDPANGDFSLQSGSPAIAIGAGLSNLDVQYTPIPSDEILEQWGSAPTYDDEPAETSYLLFGADRVTFGTDPITL